MKYLDPSFSVPVGGQNYRDGWERIFGAAKAPCGICGAEIGPDTTGRPMCYGCGPARMMPKDLRQKPARSVNHWEDFFAGGGF